MCEANVYIRRDGQDQLILESVDKLVPEPGQVSMINIFGQQKTIKARILELALVDHKIILEDL
ncbi:CooT family nickel-binding protein [Heliobacterium gestii]|uniref:CooT family nickel-binding protein n=1 Tax=Heliomicrobium gestii TaxID=2699 RepID=A0A845LJ36_HELGE|nr:CooT family nickel-binding protein [Heliomicrobium gestii]MBM7868054.1 putative RNA-binding protein [Heliomicrobium gestii]MZP44415.1 CooT family nickel-binding protein [Heliomicrobium gestii]